MLVDEHQNRTLPSTWGALNCVGINCLLVHVSKLILFLLPFFKNFIISFKFTCATPLKFIIFIISKNIYW